MALCEYNFSTDFDVTPSMHKDFDDQGYIIVRGLLDTEEVQNVKKVYTDHEELAKYAYKVTDGDGVTTRRVIWSHPGNDVTGMVARSEKIVDTCEKLLGGEVYHYHGKLMMKDAVTGGKHVWHQDYGYWYGNGNLMPDMMTVFIAIDPCKKENGCLQMLPGSHKCGRIEHVFSGQQKGADLERVAEIRKRFPLIYAELNPGDAIFFHCNVLHTSSENKSPNPRYAYLCCYNRADNNPTMVHHHPQYTPLKKVPNDAVRKCTNYTDMDGKDFIDPKNFTTVWGNREKTQERIH